MAGWLAGAWLLLSPQSAAGGSTPAYQNAGLPAETRVQDLLARMTPREKFWQLFMLAGEDGGDPARFRDGVFGLQLAEQEPAEARRRGDALQRHLREHTRLGIPAILFAEGLHGLVQREATVFPQAIGLAASFDSALVRQVAEVIAGESRAVGVRQLLSPVVNLATDGRWGRTEESYGEDPVLSSAMGAVFVRACEERGVIATPKHFVANVGEGGRDSYPVEESERRLRETHFPPFQACLQAGGARSLMTSYNSLDGSPCSAQDWLQNDVLKAEWGFRGFVISDAGAVGGANVLHFTAADYGEAAARALNSGLDVIFQTSIEHEALFLPPFLDGRIPSAVIDSAVARVLRAKFQLGLFDEPLPAAETGLPLGAESSRRLARRAAEESLVLLQNERGTLPLPAGLRRLAVLGPDADAARLGGYSATSNRAVSILAGLRERAGNDVEVRHAPGCARLSPPLPTVPAAALSSGAGPGETPGLKGEYFTGLEPAGTPAFTRQDAVVDAQWTLFSPDPARLGDGFYSVRWTGWLTPPAGGRVELGVEGNDGWRLFLDDSLLLDSGAPLSHRTRLAAVELRAGQARRLRLECRVPAGPARLRLVWSLGAAPDEEPGLRAAEELARSCDAAVVVVGLEEGEFRDRASLALPGRQAELIRRVADTGTPVTVVLVGGAPVVMEDWLEAAGAVLCAWYPGEEGGHAVARALFGDLSPAGRLPLSFPVAEGQVPLGYRHKPTGRGDDYADLTGQPRFPFGHGLSYTGFRYSDLRLPASVRLGEPVPVRCTLTNTGRRAGDEVVQLYLRDELASVARPVLELAAFRRVHLEPGESREVEFQLPAAALSLLDAQLRPVQEPGRTRVYLGASSQDLRLRGVVTVQP
ncbi:MAG: glycoside hydrolase family 3 N-terminal domain-containing protein [Candidatus Delongbacteria bacterium]